MSDDTYLGYGSLISPSVVAAYFFDDRAEKVHHKYSEKNFSDEESVLIESFVEKWRELDEVEMIPVKVEGLRRSYSLKSARGGLMLAAEKDEDSWINAVAIRGLPEEQQEILDDVESDYRKHEIELDRIQVYPQCDAELEEEPVLYLSRENEKFSPGDRQINELYHRTILQGIELLGEKYGEGFVKEFKEDFLETTFYRGEPVSDRDL